MVADAGFRLDSHSHPAQRDSRGDLLVCDAAIRGPKDARNIFIAISGTHGVEGFCGSGCQAALIDSGRFDCTAGDAAVILIHAINPYGFAWLRRTDEDNVDLNRNFVDHSRMLPNPDYDEIHDWLVPQNWDGPSRADADARIEHYIETRGIRAFQAALTGGQYNHPDGLFYGGREAAWSNRIWREILRKHCSRSHRVFIVDIHTGLGPRGVGEAICVSDEKGFRRAKEFFGEDTTWAGGKGSVSARIGGSLVHGACEELGPDRVTMIGLEFGTYPIPQTLDALRAETWLVARGDPASEQADSIKKSLRDAFYIDEPDWKRDVVKRFLGLVERLEPQLS